MTELFLKKIQINTLIIKKNAKKSMMGSKIKIIEENLENGLKWKRLIKDDYIAGGSYGTVFKYTHSHTSQSFAVKLIPYMKNSDDKEKIGAEIALLNLLSEIPNVSKYFPKFYGYIRFLEETPEGKKTKNYALVSELAKGTLKDYAVHNCPNGLSFQENLTLLECLSSGLSALQEKKISHRDLKPENLLYFSDKNLISFKIIDFGEVKMNVDAEGTVRGAPLYLSPESNFAYLKDLDKISQDYNPFKSDVYSIGLTFLFVNLLKLPFQKDKNTTNSNISRKNLTRGLEKICDPLNTDKGPYDEAIKGMIDLIVQKFENEKGIAFFKRILEKCLEYSPKKRIDLLELNQDFEVLMIEREGSNPNVMTNTLEFLKEIEKRDQMNKILSGRNEVLMKELDKERIEKESYQKKYYELLEQTRREKMRFEEKKLNEFKIGKFFS